jgi:hypothetical protein
VESPFEFPLNGSDANGNVYIDCSVRIASSCLNPSISDGKEHEKNSRVKVFRTGGKELIVNLESSRHNLIITPSGHASILVMTCNSAFSSKPDAHFDEAEEP